MTPDDELLINSLRRLGENVIDDAELDYRVAKFKDALGRLRDDPSEAARIDALVLDAQRQRQHEPASAADEQLVEEDRTPQGSLTLLGKSARADNAHRLPFPPSPRPLTHSRSRGRRAATPLVRAYAVTGGRAELRRNRLPIEALVTSDASEEQDLSVLAPERRAILQLCTAWRSVAEISAVLAMPLDAVRVLIADMDADGLVRIHQRDDSGDHLDLHLLEKVLGGLHGI